MTVFAPVIIPAGRSTIQAPSELDEEAIASILRDIADKDTMAMAIERVSIIPCGYSKESRKAVLDTTSANRERPEKVRAEKERLARPGEERYVKAEKEAQKERRAKVRAEREAEEERLARAGAKREGEEERLSRARAEGEGEEQKRAKAEERKVTLEKESKEETWTQVEREAYEQRATIESVAQEVSHDLKKLVAEDERHKREAEEEKERWNKAKREAEEEERQARAKRKEEIENGETLYKAICGNTWIKVKEFLDENPSFLTTKVTSSGKTTLHVAALFGHVPIVEELVSLVAPEFLETTDDFGNTPLLIATITGITHVAKCLVDKNSNILGIRNSTEELPVTLAFLNGHPEMGRYLYSKTPLDYLCPEKAPLQGAMLLHSLLQTQCFDIALDLLDKCPELLFASDKEGRKPIECIATMNSSPQNEIVFWKRLIIDCINSNSSSDHDRLPIQQQRTSAKENLTAGHRLLQRVISSTDNLLGTKKIQEQKLLHVQADKILDLVCKNAGRIDQVSVIADALFLAAKEGNVEFVLRVSKANPELLLLGDSSYQNIFFYAVQNRQARVFNLIHGLRFKHVVVTSKDIRGNTLLHVAAVQAPAPVLNRIYGPTLQMQSELQWFTEVEKLVPETIRKARNNEGMTAEDLFKEKHKHLMKDGEKWIKATAASYSVVGILIVTITFAVAFTLPGGNDQDSGFPKFIKQRTFTFFILSTVVSLVSSSTSVLMFLAILTSPFSKEAFLEFLPSKLLFGVSALLISIVTMIITFLSAIHLSLKHTNYSWGILPVIVFTCVPISYSIFSLMPVIRNTAISAYGSVFNKKGDKWP